MTELERTEYDKCLRDPHYFFNKYITIRQKMVVREEIKGREHEEVKSIYFKYFSGSELEEDVRLMEKVTQEDGECNYVLHFRNSPYRSAVVILFDDVVKLSRKEKIGNICEKMHENS